MADSDGESRLAGFATLLAAHPDAVVAAMADDGCRIPLPDAFPLGEHRALGAPAERATLLDVVVPADRIGVVAAWERSRKDGIAVAAVHATSDPEKRLTLTTIDARERYGTWLAALTPDDEASGSGPRALPCDRRTGRAA
jgi:hypothetical protein